MQHYKYSVFKRFYCSPEIASIKTFFKANIKTLYTYPRSIWYSLRYNSGENFMLYNSSLYPFRYNDTNVVDVYDGEPVGVSNKLISHLNELSLHNYVKSSSSSEVISERESIRNVKILHEGINETLTELMNIYKYKGDKINLPAVVSSRVLYALAQNSIFRFSENLKIEEEEITILLNNFQQKLEYADGESIANVLYALNHFKRYDQQIWNELLTPLKTKQFQPDFTQVSNKTPFLFRYQENECFDCESIDNLASNLYFKGYKPVFELYTTLLDAQSKGINTEELQTSLNSRFSYLKKNYTYYLKY